MPGQCDGPFCKITQDASGTILWGYWQPDARLDMQSVSYFLTSTRTKRGDEVTHCTCLDHFWGVKRGITGHACKHMERLGAEIAPTATANAA